MAGNALTIGARFKPMSYAEMLAPVQAATNEFNLQTEELDKLNQASSVWENMANKETDPLAYQKYSNFANTLRQQADALATQGLNPNSRKAISQMKGQYQSDIVPIEQAYKTRADMAKSYEAARRQNPTLMSNIDPSRLSLDKLIANPSLAPEFYSGNLLAEQVSAKARVLASQLRETGQWKSTAGGQMLERIEKYGLSPKDVAMVQAGQGPKELQDLVNSTISSSPIGKWENAKELLPQAYQYAASGLYSGIGKEDIKTGQDQSYMTPQLKYQMSKDQERSRLAAQKAAAKVKGINVDQEDIITPRLLERMDKNLLVNGKVSQKGYDLIKDYMHGKLAPKMIISDSPLGGSKDLNLGKRRQAEEFIRATGIGNLIKQNKGIGVETINKQISNALTNQSYDGMLTRTNRLPLQPLASETIARKLMSLPENTVFTEIEDIDKSGKYVGSGGIKASKLFKTNEDYQKILKLNYNKNNETITFNVGGKNYILPNSVLSPANFEALHKNSVNSQNEESMDNYINQHLPEGMDISDLEEQDIQYLRQQYQNSVVEGNQKELTNLMGSYAKTAM